MLLCCCSGMGANPYRHISKSSWKPSQKSGSRYSSKSHFDMMMTQDMNQNSFSETVGSHYIQVRYVSGRFFFKNWFQIDLHSLSVVCIIMLIGEKNFVVTFKVIFLSSTLERSTLKQYSTEMVRNKKREHCLKCELHVLHYSWKIFSLKWMPFEIKFIKWFFSGVKHR